MRCTHPVLVAAVDACPRRPASRAGFPWRWERDSLLRLKDACELFVLQRLASVFSRSSCSARYSLPGACALVGVGTPHRRSVARGVHRSAVRLPTCIGRQCGSARACSCCRLTCVASTCSVPSHPAHPIKTPSQTPGAPFVTAASRTQRRDGRCSALTAEQLAKLSSPQSARLFACVSRAPHRFVVIAVASTLPR